MKKLSIIIPFYNVEEYLEECYNSVYNAALNYLDDIEIILVDDCGNDNSANIAQRIKKQSTIIVKNSSNLGLGGARNTGVANASGEWLMFIDSDDKIKTNAIELLLKKIASNKELNVIKYGFIKNYKDKAIAYTYNVKDKDMHKPGMSWAKIIKRNLFIKFEEHLKYEDTYWKYKFITTNKNHIKLGIINKPLYIYNKTNDNSITSSISYYDLNWIYSKIVIFYKHTNDKNVKQELYEMICENTVNYCITNFDFKMGLKSLIFLIRVNPFSIKKNKLVLDKMLDIKLERKIIEK